MAGKTEFLIIFFVASWGCPLTMRSMAGGAGHFSLLKGPAAYVIGRLYAYRIFSPACFDRMTLSAEFRLRTFQEYPYAAAMTGMTNAAVFFDIRYSGRGCLKIS
jgi:hypothetical protein